MKNQKTNFLWRGVLAVPALTAAAFLAIGCSPETPTGDATTAAPQTAPEVQPVADTSGATTATAGKMAPDFTLTDTNGKKHSLADFRGKYVVLEWNNLECPFVKKHYGSGNMQRLQKQATEDGVVWLIVNSSAEGKQGNYTPAQHNEKMKANGAAQTAVLLDTSGEVGKLYKAKTTPHMFVISPTGEKLYDGAIDDNSSADPATIEGSKNYVVAALTEARADKKVTTPVTQPYGCSVKY